MDENDPECSGLRSESNLNSARASLLMRRHWVRRATSSDGCMAPKMCSGAWRRNDACECCSQQPHSHAPARTFWGADRAASCSCGRRRGAKGAEAAERQVAHPTKLQIQHRLHSRRRIEATQKKLEVSHVTSGLQGTYAGAVDQILCTDVRLYILLRTI